MFTDSLIYKSNIAARQKCEEDIKQLQLQIKSKENDIKQLKQDLQDKLSAKFYDVYEEYPETIMIAYVNRLRDCCGQGGKGYKWWLFGRYGKYKPDYHHCVVIDYERAQPSQKELDAYWIMTETEMVVTQKPHIEHWGN